MRASLIRALRSAMRNATTTNDIKPRARFFRGGLLLAAALMILPVADSGQQPVPLKPGSPSANRPPDKNEQAQMREEQSDPKGPDEARIHQISQQSDQLFALALTLKTEVDKAGKDTLSLTVIRKADEIRKLAHNVREEMVLVKGTN